MNKLKRILIIVFVFIPVILFCSGCNCSGSEEKEVNTDTTCTVRFITNSPVTFNIGPYEVNYGDTLREPNRPSSFEKTHDDGYTYVYSFVGWYEDPECTNLWLFANEVTRDMDLYAKWDIRHK